MQFKNQKNSSNDTAELPSSQSKKYIKILIDGIHDTSLDFETSPNHLF